MSVDASKELPHIVLIMVDDMGYGDAGCYNAESKIQTPYIDGLARAGTRFTDAHASGPLCHLSRYGLMTGRYPFRTNVGIWPKQPVIQPEQLTVPELLKAAGYSTHMVGKWHLGFKEEGYDKPLPGGPVDCGFDTFFGIRASTDIPPYFYIRDDRAVAPPTDTIEARSTEGWSPIQGEFWRAGGIAPNLELVDVLPRFTQEAVNVIERHGKASSADSNEGKISSPLFLYLALPAPHTPWLPTPDFVDKSQADMYGDFMVMVDAMVGRVLDQLEASGLEDETLVIFTSDNGPVWYESDVERLGHDSSGGWRGMKADAWEAGHRMPFIVRWPGRTSANHVSDRLVSFVDVLATFAELTDQDLPEAQGPDSFSFLAEIDPTQEQRSPGRETWVMASGNGMKTVRIGSWKLIDGLGSGGFSKPGRIKPKAGEPKGQLYHLGDDPGETTNLYEEHPEVVERLRKEMERVISSESSR